MRSDIFWHNYRAMRLIAAGKPKSERLALSQRLRLGPLGLGFQMGRAIQASMKDQPSKPKVKP